MTRKDIRGPATSNTCARCTTTLNSYSDAFRLFASKQITPPFDSTRFNFSLKRPKRVVRCADLTMLKFRKLNCDLLSFHFLAHEKLSSFKYRNNEEGGIARLTCIESIPRIESKIRKWRFFGKLPPQATGFLRVHASKKREERVASKVKKGRGRKRRSGGTREGGGEGATISGRRTSCTAYPRHRTSKVRARGNTRAEMPPMPRQRRTECVPAGRRPRGTSTMADEAAPRGKLTFNIQANPLQAKPLCIRLRIKVWTIGKKEFRQEKFHVFFIYISISIVKVWKFWKMSGSIVRRTKTYEIRNNLNCLFNNLFKKKMKLRKKRGNVSTSKFLIQSQLGERLQDKTERRRTFNRRKRTSKRNKRKRRG